MKQSGFILHLSGVEQPLSVEKDESLLTAIERAGYRMQKSCRNGVCEVCELVLLDGRVQQRYPVKTLSNNKNSAERVRVLACTATPLTDIRVNIEGLKAFGEQSVKKLCCEITGVEQLNDDVCRVRLRLPATASLAVEFKAGQYLDVILPDGKQASFSIGSAPEQGRDLELHIRYTPDSEMSNAIMSHLQNSPSVNIELPKGDCCLSAASLSPETRLIFAAASTGFAQVKSQVEHLLANQVANPVYIYWGARVEADLYLISLAQQWQAEHANVHFVPVVSEPENSVQWQGRTGLLPAVVLEDFADFEQTEIFASGSPGMVYALLDAVESRGFQEDKMHSDVFAYAPRP
ncbi:MAG: 2Fe-2S iron-sulfur cluster-binding protein [Pontibacterium sp.]